MFLAYRIIRYRNQDGKQEQQKFHLRPLQGIEHFQCDFHRLWILPDLLN
jgi:hypothetical protein